MAFVDFLEPSTRLPPTGPSRGILLSGDSGEFGGPRLSYRPGGSNERFDLRKAKGDPAKVGSESPGTLTRTLSRSSRSSVAESPLISPARSETAAPQNSFKRDSFGPKLQLGSPGRISLAPNSGAASPCPPTPGSGTVTPRAPSSAVPRHLKANDVRLQHSFEKNVPSSLRRSISSFGETTSSGETGTNHLDVFAAAAPEDVANDEALGAYLAASNAAARTRKQRQSQELLRPSEKLLNTQATRRNRRMSSDSRVCETRPWVTALEGSNAEAKREAAKSIRTALKDGPENRMRLVGSGGVAPLVRALGCPDAETVEHAAAAILFLCMSVDSAREVVASGGVRQLVDVVAGGSKLGGAVLDEAARSNAAAALFALSQTEDNRKMVIASGAVKPLAQLLKQVKLPRGKKDACLALFNMALHPKGAEEMVDLGVVERAVEILEEGEEGVEEKAAALLGGLAKTPAGVRAIEENDDVLYALVDTLEGGTRSAAEHAATALHCLAKEFPTTLPRILAEGCLPPLVSVASLSKKGSDARALLELLRTHCRVKAKKEADAKADIHKKFVSMPHEAVTRSPSRFGSVASSPANLSTSKSARASEGLGRPPVQKSWSGDVSANGTK